MTLEQEAAPAAAEEDVAPPVEQAEDDADKIWAEIQTAKDSPPPPDDQAERSEKPQPPLAEIHAKQLAAEERRKEQLETLASTATGEDHERYEQGIRSAAGRIRALQTKLAAASEGADRDTTSAREKIAGIRDDYPEIAKPIEEAIGAIEGKLERISKAEQSAHEADVAELNSLIEAETNRLLEVHGDYQDVLSKHAQEFRNWLSDPDQKIGILDAARRNANAITDSKGAIQVIAGFKRHLGLVEDDQKPDPQPSLSDRRARQKEALSTPARTGGRPTVSGIPPEGDPQAIWDAIQAEKERKRR